MAYRVVLCSFDYFPPIGGQGRHFMELSLALQQRGVAVSIISSSAPNNFPHISALSLLNGWPHGHRLFSMWLRYRIDDYIDQLNPDVVIINGGPGGVNLPRPFSVPTIVVANHTYRQQSALPNQAWKSLFVKREAQSYENATQLVAISSSTRDNLISSYGVAPEKIAVIPPGVDLDRFSVSDQPPTRSILYVGRLESRKGIEFLVECMPLLAHTASGIRLTVVGAGTLGGKLKLRAQALGVSSQIDFLGHVSDESLMTLYHRHQLLVVPSLMEGFGMVATEAAACGLPVLASRVSGLTDAVIEHESGEFFALGDVPEFLAQVTRMLTTNGLMERRARARLAMEQRFGWDAIAQRYVELFDTLAR